MTIVLLVPAYQPDVRLPALLSAVRRLDPRIDLLVVDDGSAGSCAPVFDACRALGATVLHHGVNRGKGVALRTGLAHVLLVSPSSSVVTADADGQHLPADVVRVADRLRDRSGDRRGDRQQTPFVRRGGAGPPRQKAPFLRRGGLARGGQQTPFVGRGGGGGRAPLVLGVRSFGADDVPLRSKVGNRVSALLVRAATGRALVDDDGRALADTQTGLRGFTAELLPWLSTVPGDRFEYELRVLLEAARRGVRVEQVPISTVYLAGNASSHFAPVRDSVRVYRPLVLFLLSSFSAFLLDLAALLVLGTVTGSLWLSVVGARLLSGTVNYTVNRRLVFAAPRSRRSAVGYVMLAGSLLAANLAIITGLTGAGLPLLAAKLLTEALLVAISFAAQRAWVFRHRHRCQASSDGSDPEVADSGSLASDDGSPVAV